MIFVDLSHFLWYVNKWLFFILFFEGGESIGLLKNVSQWLSQINSCDVMKNIMNSIFGLMERRIW